MSYQKDGTRGGSPELTAAVLGEAKGGTDNPRVGQGTNYYVRPSAEGYPSTPHFIPGRPKGMGSRK